MDDERNEVFYLSADELEGLIREAVRRAILEAEEEMEPPKDDWFWPAAILGIGLMLIAMVIE